ncbi:MAG TPA: hypothetical protein VLB89_04145 [Gaiellaceae bacterium]|nr:hypothetical protein [Gaiellaceae bacterium]
MAESDDHALEQAREWKGALVDEHYTDSVVDPAEIYRHGESEISDSKFTKEIITSSDPGQNLRRGKLLE